MNRVTRLMVAIGLCLGLMGCSNTPKEDLGLVGGGVVGGAAGYALSGGPVGTAAGAVGGAYVGKRLAEE